MKKRGHRGRKWAGQGLSRRQLLARGGAAAAAVGLFPGCGPDDAPAPPLVGEGWGLPASDSEAEALLPSAALPDNVLEFFFFGGLNMWDTFYAVPEFGGPGSGFGQPWMLWTFMNEGGPDSLRSWFERCGGQGDVTRAWAPDATGRTVHLGPLLHPLWDRPDVVSRMRMWVVAHEETAHQGAVPLSLCGLPRNNARRAGTAAHLARFHADHGRADRVVPWSYVTYPQLDDLSSLNGDSASSIGLHRASARPVGFRLGPAGLVSDQLGRLAVQGRKTEVDQAVDLYVQRYRERLAWMRGERVARAGHFEDFSVARAGLGVSDRILALLSEQATSGAVGAACGDTSQADYTAMGLQVATELLTHPTDAAKYVCVVDGGLFPADGGAAYDTHVKHVRDSTRNTVHAMRQLLARINEPGEDDPAKIDLDRQMVLLTTEFGRSPFAGGDGLDHWPGGYGMIAIGGPVDEERAGIVGAIDQNANAVSAITPGDFRAAMLLAQGIWPFSEQSFAVSDISEGATERDAAMYLREVVLGYPAS